MKKVLGKNYHSNQITAIASSTLTSNEIEFFKHKLKKAKSKILKNLNIASSDMDSVMNTNPKDEADFASVALEQSLGNTIIERQISNLKEIEYSLEKIKLNCYGTCEMCEEDIIIERLQIKPFAMYCIPCREILEKERK